VKGVKSGPSTPAEACSFDPETQKLALVVVPRLENTTLGGPDGIGGKIQA